MPACPHCDTETMPEDRYCPQCGKRIVADDLDNPAMTQGAMDIGDVRFKLGMVYFKKGEHKRAVETWEKVLLDDPDNVELKRLIQATRSQYNISEA